MPRNVLNVNNDSELLSYIINANPELREAIDLPVQGESIAPIGRIIVSNERYKNAFINTINLIGLTIIDRNGFDDPWQSFTERGRLNFGQTVREIFVEIAKAFDYHETVDNPANFLNTVVPDIFNYLHELNFQKYYKTTTSDEEIAMSFNREGELMNLITKIIESNYGAYQYDRYIISKYMLCRRILDGTMPAINIPNYNSLTYRERAEQMKSISNKMTFKKPNYNPAGVRTQSAFADQFLIMDTSYEAGYSTSVLATSFFQDPAMFKTNLALCDGFNEHDTARLMEVLKDQYVPFTDAELTALAKVPAVLIDREWFQIYTYNLDNSADPSGDGLRSTSFFNPETLRNTHWLHVWKVFSTSPFMNGVVFLANVNPAVSSVVVSPDTADVYAGQNIQLTSTVTTNGFANKAVSYSIESDSETAPAKMATVNTKGLVRIPAGHNVQNNGTQGVYTITIGTALATGESVKINDVTYNASSTDDTATKQATAIKNLFASDTDYTVTSASAVITFTEKSGKYGAGAPTVVAELTTGEVTEATTTPGVAASTGQVVVRATSVFDTTKYDDATLTVK